MSLDEIIVGVTSYVEQEIARPAPSGLQKFIYYSALPFVGTTIKDMAFQYENVALSAGLVDEDGKWDLVKLKEATTEAIRKSGSFEIAGIIFREEDLSKLWSYLKV